jgi:hypothetical protein
VFVCHDSHCVRDERFDIPAARLFDNVHQSSGLAKLGHDQTQQLGPIAGFAKLVSNQIQQITPIYRVPLGLADWNVCFQGKSH